MTAICVLTTGTARNPIGGVARLDMMIAIGFGAAVVTRNGQQMIDGEGAAQAAGGPVFTVRDAEDMAAKDPDAAAVWRIEIDGPLWSAKWERQGPSRWVCVAAGEGFA